MEYVILGHSERRQYFGETDETVKVNCGIFSSMVAFSFRSPAKRGGNYSVSSIKLRTSEVKIFAKTGG